MIFGYTGSFRVGQIIQYKMDIIPQMEDEDDMEYMCTTFVDEMRDCLENNKVLKIENEVAECEEAAILVGYGHRKLK